MALRRRGRPTLGGVALELASPCCATLARRPRRSGVRRGVVAPGRAEAGAPLVLALGLCVTVVPAAACHFCASGMDTGSPRRPATGTIRYLGYRASDIDTLGTKGIRYQLLTEGKGKKPLQTKSDSEEETSSESETEEQYMETDDDDNYDDDDEYGFVKGRFCNGLGELSQLTSP
ncbi:hypothetical protein OsJ_11273 [Oryza sativa Japonica Group]|uniref:Uncharacterized protein n=1 Tax=Oryza sativa subsp. japonica TaxID=39947 RepID=A3AJ44_ORYSJ|nr:hypothetical protein OsJ_11273 [Oryza sativa Japonica Group]